MKTRIFLLFLCAAMILSAAGCASSGGSGSSSSGTADTAGTSADEGPVSVECRDLTLTVPAKYRDLVIVKADTDDMLFSAWEKESVEAAERLHTAAGESFDPDGGEGWLFGITAVSEAQLHEMLCEDMSGVQVFARAADGTAFLLLHPTDVRLVRDGDDAYGKEDLAEWAFLSEWTAEVPESFAADNGLAVYRRSNTPLDMTLARLLYRGNVNYELVSLAHGAFAPDAVDAAPYLEALSERTYEWADESETPDGEYIVLRLPDEDIRYDFFLGGDGSYVREVRGEYETLYRAADGADVISPVRSWYDALSAASGKRDYDYGAYDLAVQDVLDEYAALDLDALENYDESMHPELPWYTAAIANTARNDLYYGFYDFDGNDVPELIIAAGDDSWQVPEAIYAFDGNAMRYLCKEHPLGERAYLTWNGELFAVHGSGGAATGSVAIFKIAADGFGTDLIEVMDYEYSDAQTVTYTPELGRMTAEEFAALDLGDGVGADVGYTRFASRNGEELIGMANPFSAASSAEEAAQGAGLEYFILPEVFACFADGHDEPSFRFMDGMAEAQFNGSGSSLLLRKGIGTDDISGDWNLYPEEWDIVWKGLTIHCRGEQDSVRTAWWTFGDHTFSLSFNIDDSALPGLTGDEVTSLVNQIQ